MLLEYLGETAAATRSTGTEMANSAPAITKNTAFTTTDLFAALMKVFNVNLMAQLRGPLPPQSLEVDLHHVFDYSS